MGARHADVGDAAVPVGFAVGDAGYDDDVVFQALEAGDGGPGGVLERGAAEVGDVGFGEAAEGGVLGQSVSRLADEWACARSIHGGRSSQRDRQD